MGETASQNTQCSGETVVGRRKKSFTGYIFLLQEYRGFQRFVCKHSEEVTRTGTGLSQTHEVRQESEEMNICSAPEDTDGRALECTAGICSEEAVSFTDEHPCFIAMCIVIGTCDETGGRTGPRSAVDLLCIGV